MEVVPLQKHEVKKISFPILISIEGGRFQTLYNLVPEMWNLML